MKRFFSWTATDERNEKFNDSLVLVTDAEVWAQLATRVPGYRIPVSFLDDSEEEQSITVRPGVIDFPQKPFKKNWLQRSNSALLA